MQSLTQKEYRQWSVTDRRVRRAVSGLRWRWPEGQSEGCPSLRWELSLPAATWHRSRAQRPIVQTWLRKAEQGRDSSVPQQASFSRQT